MKLLNIYKLSRVGILIMGFTYLKQVDTYKWYLVIEKVYIHESYL